MGRCFHRLKTAPWVGDLVHSDMIPAAGARQLLTTQDLSKVQSATEICRWDPWNSCGLINVTTVVCNESNKKKVWDLADLVQTLVDSSVGDYTPSVC